MKKVSLTILALSAASLLSGCSNSTDDLTTWMANETAQMKGKVTPLPPVTPFIPVNYAGEKLSDPFAPKKEARVGSANAPDQARKKEFLESYPLDRIQMVGTILKKGVQWGIIRTPDNNINMVRAGNYMGQNFGRIVAITEGNIKLKETIQDAQGDWVEQDYNLELIDGGQNQH